MNRSYKINKMAGDQSQDKSPLASTTQKSLGDKTFSGAANLIKLLPTGTVFVYQFLSPSLTNYGHCDATNKYLTAALLAVCGFSCAFASFTDSYTGSDGRMYYGIVTRSGLRPFSDSNAGSTELSRYRLRVGDFVHAFFSLVVFGVLGLMDPNTVGCYYPTFESSQKALLMAVPPVVGVVSSIVFVMFPNNRHGIGFPTNESNN